MFEEISVFVSGSCKRYGSCGDVDSNVQVEIKKNIYNKYNFHDLISVLSPHPSLKLMLQRSAI